MKSPVEPFYAELGRRIAVAREGKGWTQQHLGASLKPQHTRASIANLEKGKQRILTHTLVDLAIALGQTPADLLPPLPSPEATTAVQNGVGDLDLPPEKKEALLKLLGLPTTTTKEARS